MTFKKQYRLYDKAFTGLSITPTADQAYFAGLLATDGSIRHDRYQYDVALSLQKRDEDAVRKFKRFLSATHPIKVRQHKGTNWQDSVTLTVRSEQLVLDLIEAGITPKKSKTLEVSKSLLLSRDFWRGAIDGDGYVGFNNKGHRYQHPRVELCTGSSNFAEQYAQFLRVVVGVEANVRITKRGHYTIVTSTKKAAKLVSVLYDASYYYMDRKYNESRNLIAHVPLGASRKTVSLDGIDYSLLAATKKLGIKYGPVYRKVYVLGLPPEVALGLTN